MKYWRTNLIFLFIILFAAAIIGRLIFLQIINQDYWRALAKGQQKIFLEIPGKRGEIFLSDRNNNLYSLAINRDFDLVYVAPNEIINTEDTAEVLAKILTLEKDFILSKLQADSLYELIKNKLPREETEDIKNLNLSGVYLGKETFRYYPQQFLASHVAGFFGRDETGQYGVEGYHDDILKGTEGFREGERTAQGFFLAFYERFSPAKEGTDLVLTLDYNIQFKAEKLLKEAGEELEVEEGTIIVINPYSGKILAMANFPNFNPNQYSEVKNFEIFQNGAIQKIFEPGSVFKPIVVAAALDQRKITPDTSYTDKGFVKIGGYTIYNYDKRVWGKRTVTEVLEKSINTGAVFVETRIGHNLFLQYIEKFGIFEKTGIDLEGEVFSTNSNLKEGYEINFATASFGQGIEMTAIQLARAFSVIANGGRLVKPYSVKSLTTFQKEGFDQTDYAKDGGVQVISQKTASQLTAMLVSVVDNGFGKGAKIPGYFIAGKTGTAQVPFGALGINKSGYSDKTIQTFIGFAPAFNPQFLILVKLYNPQTKTAEYSAIPVFKKLAKYIIDYYQIPPDYE
ncbi:penicillin-binding protein 2 [Patescibacteria group bacterium]|nr:penicillin-binding protein 2 [Patescibacteria group bacterium]